MFYSFTTQRFKLWVTTSTNWTVNILKSDNLGVKWWGAPACLKWGGGIGRVEGGKGGVESGEWQETYLRVELPWAASGRAMCRWGDGQRDRAAGARRAGAAMFIWLEGFSSAVYPPPPPPPPGCLCRFTLKCHRQLFNTRNKQSIISRLSAQTFDYYCHVSYKYLIF